MNIVVFIKPVPDTAYYNKITIDPVSKRLMRDGIPTVINQSDKNALEYAFRLKDSSGSNRIIVISMAPLFSLPLLKKCLAMGADEAYLVSDKAFGGADTFSTSYTLSKALEKIQITADLILCGNESADGATSHVPSQIGEWLNLPHISNISSLKIDDEYATAAKKIENGTISYKIKLPALFSLCRDSNTPRTASAYGVVKARGKRITVFTRDDLDVEDCKIGLAGSPTKPGEIMVPETKRSAKEITGNEKQIAQELYKIIRRSGFNMSGGLSL